MSRKTKADTESKAARKPKVDIASTDELGLTGGGQKMSIVAWVLSAFVIAAGIVALIVTGEKIFILFIVLGILTPLNVLAYDNLILKPKVARLKTERAKEAEQQAREAAEEAREAEEAKQAEEAREADEVEAAEQPDAYPKKETDQ